MKKKFKITFFFLFSIFLYSCSGGSGGALKQELKTTANEINKVFVDIRTAVEKLDIEAEKAFSELGKMNLDTKKMDLEEGGKYKLFEESAYYKPKDDGGCSLYVSGVNKPLTEENKRVVKMYEKLCTAIKETKNSSKFIAISWVISKKTECASSPYVDTISALGTTLDAPKFPWYTIADLKNNPEKKAKWMGPFIVLLGSGWSETIISPIYANDKMEGIVTTDITLRNIVLEFLTNKKSMMMLVSQKDLILVGSSKVAQDKLKLKELAFDYVELLKQNPNLAEDFKLTNYKDEGIKALAARLQKGESEFEMKLGDKNYIINVEKISEVDFYLVGFSEK